MQKANEIKYTRREREREREQYVCCVCSLVLHGSAIDALRECTESSRRGQDGAGG